MVSQPLNSEKIAILGIDNAGKTSIIKTLAQEFYQIEGLLPTQNVERSIFDFLGKELIFWDFGGQTLYREKYLENPERHFDDISKCFYVLDVQDANSIEDSIKYFEACYTHIYAFSPENV